MKRRRQMTSPGGGRHPGISRRAFTLVELLAVAGLIVLLGGMAGLALGGRGGDGAALASAQSIVAGLVSAARAQAVLHHTNARLIVHAEPPPAGSAAKYLRCLQVVREEPFESGSFSAVGVQVVLPDSVYIVPAATMPADHLIPGVTWPGSPSPVSTLIMENSFRYSSRGDAGGQLQYFGHATGGRIFFLQFGPDGSVTEPVAGAAVAIATAVPDAVDNPKFNNPSGVRGVRLRRSGSIALVHDSGGF